MFRGINLCGAEVNTKFSEQHRTHLLHSHIIFIVISSPLVVKSARPSYRLNCNSSAFNVIKLVAIFLWLDSIAGV